MIHGICFIFCIIFGHNLGFTQYNIIIAQNLLIVFSFRLISQILKHFYQNTLIQPTSTPFWPSTSEWNCYRPSDEKNSFDDFITFYFSVSLRFSLPFRLLWICWLKFTDETNPKRLVHCPKGNELSCYFFITAMTILEHHFIFSRRGRN